MAALPPVDPTTTNIFGLSQFDPSKFQVGGQTQFFDLDKPLLSHGFGWFVIAGFSAIFALLALLFVWGEKRVNPEYKVESAEQFNTGGRQLGTGLIATDIVSHWTFPTVLLSSVSFAFQIGVGAALWTSTGGIIVVWLFAVLAIELKYKAPTAHTFLELVMVRWGKTAHAIFYLVGVLTNLLVSINMLQGAVVVTNALTGINIYAICYVVPFGIALYAVTGGLKATFVTSWVHTIVIFVTIVVFYVATFFHGSVLGSIHLVYERLLQWPQYNPLPGNRGGSPLTAWSVSGLELAIVGTITAFSQLVTDQAYWQSAIAAAPSKAAKGYVLGSVLYGAIMFALPMSLGLALFALDLPVSPGELENGLAFPAAAYALCGKTGLYLTVIICFMSVTSSGAGEMVAVSSLITFSAYRYVRPQASNKELVLCSRIGIVLWAAVMGVAQTVVYTLDIPVLLTGLMMSVILGGGVPPVIFALTWRRCTALGACCGVVLGSACGTACWFLYALYGLGGITNDNLVSNYALLTGACISLGSSALLCVVLSFIRPDKELFRWEQYTEEITMTDEDTTGFQPHGTESIEHLKRSRPWVWAIAGGAFLCFMVIWPLLTLPAGRWSYGYFAMIVWLFFILLLFGTAMTTFYPLWESRAAIWAGLTCRKLEPEQVSSLPVTTLTSIKSGLTATRSNLSAAGRPADYVVGGKDVVDGKTAAK